MKHITDYLEREQVQTLLDYAQACSTRDYLMLRVLWRTGIRVSELLAMRPQDLEPHNQVVNILKGKRGKQRRVMLDSETLGLLSEYIMTQEIPENQPIFPLSSVQVWNICRTYGKMAGLPFVHPHTFRHSYAINLVRSGVVDIRRVQLLLGHSDLNTTQVYLQFKDEDLRDVYNKVEF